jgi:hypothetical protein
MCIENKMFCKKNRTHQVEWKVWQSSRFGTEAKGAARMESFYFSSMLNINFSGLYFSIRIYTDIELHARIEACSSAKLNLSDVISTNALVNAMNL